MPPLLTLVARRSDGLPLVATQTPQPNMPITSKQQQEAKDILRSITHSASKMSVVSGQRIYYYMTRDSLCFLTMTEESYPKRLAFTYLDEVADVVLGELLKEFSNEVCCSHVRVKLLKIDALGSYLCRLGLAAFS